MSIRKRLKILVVEDDFAFRTLIKNILQHAHHQIMEADRGQKALEILEKTKVDIILLDIMMPAMSGIALLRLLRSDPRMSDTAVLFCTSLSEKKTVQEAVSLGINGYLVKPISAKSLREKVNKVAGEIRPIAGNPRRTMAQLEVNIGSYRELLLAFAQGTLPQLRELQSREGNWNSMELRDSFQSIVATADNLGLDSIKYAATQALTAISSAAPDTMCKHLMNLELELERLAELVPGLFYTTV